MTTTFFDDKVDFFYAMEEQSPFAGLLDELVAWAACPAGAVVADLGAGPGGLLRRLPEARGVAIDFSLPMAARAQALGHAAVQGDAMQVPLRAGSCDAVFVTNVLHLVSAPAAVAAESFRVLRPGGLFLAIVPGPRMGEASLRAFLEREHGAAVAEMLAGWGRSADNNRRFTPAEMEALLEGAGFATVEGRLRWEEHALLARAVR
ncbi:class I SAM-dependent methyltransferase [Vulgatibacter sp.]|uniref:class I SAM-dependent methyltransferase n=1 Tax=Vulgatibacter sp. TaxID=1971226 RepID=UPI003565F05C